jgi:hypothetical protein
VAAAQIKFLKIDKQLAKSNPFALNFVLQFCPTAPEETAPRAEFTDIGIARGKSFAAGQLSEML